MDKQAAQDLTGTILQFLAGDMELLGRFLALSGTDPADLRGLVDQPGFQIGLLDFLLGHEPTLLAFCGNYDVPPADIQRAKAALSNGNIGNDPEFDTDDGYMN